ncbi:UNVERIFIED_ORG: hypothetical protein ABIB19_003799 [Arthrobacter sp. UYEF10]
MTAADLAKFEPARRYATLFAMAAPAHRNPGRRNQLGLTKMAESCTGVTYAQLDRHQASYTVTASLMMRKLGAYPARTGSPLHCCGNWAE